MQVFLFVFCGGWFIIKRDSELLSFPHSQVKLCGHATLAASHTLFSNGLVSSDIIEFDTLSGILTAKKVPESINPESVSNGEAKESFLIELDFPVVPLTEFFIDAVSISKALNSAPIIDLKKTTTFGDLFVIPPIPFLFNVLLFTFLYFRLQLLFVMFSHKFATKHWPYFKRVMFC